MLNMNMNMNMSYGAPYGGQQCCGGGFGQGLNPMMNSQMMMFGMLAMTMMEMMRQMMGSVMNGGFPMAQMPGQFGQPGFGMPGMGGLGGSPLNGFLGGGMPYGGMPYGGMPGHGGGGAAHGANGGGSAPAMGPVGDIGNFNVESLVNAISSPLRPHARKSWPSILAECKKQGVTNKAQIAYILATTVHESGAGKYMKELISDSTANRNYGGRLGNDRAGDGARYKGRGFVQITGEGNYRDWSKRLGVDLVGNPALAERPDIAAKILVGGMKLGTFTGKKLDDYINGGRTDFRNARRIVNGTNKMDTFAATAQKILQAMG